MSQIKGYEESLNLCAHTKADLEAEIERLQDEQKNIGVEITSLQGTEMATQAANKTLDKQITNHKLRIQALSRELTEHEAAFAFLSSEYESMPTTSTGNAPSSSNRFSNANM